MKILVIAKNVGRIAPGLVAEKLIAGLAKIHEVDILTTDYDPSIPMKEVKKVINLPYKQVHARISRTLIAFFCVNPLDLFFVKRTVASVDEKYDCILSIISSDHFVSLLIGNSLAEKLKTKHYAHFLDAIPAPGGWTRNNHFFTALKKFMAKNLPKLDGVLSTNEQMLNYQLSLFTPKKKTVKEIIYNPGAGKLLKYKKNEAYKNTFLFTGGIYGFRTPDYVLRAFKVILKEYPNSTLEFVGSILSPASLEILDSAEISHVIIHPYTRDLTPFYERSIAFIDIDADLPNDVFISSKMVDYLNINRTIISVTGLNSPSRHLFKDLPSILQVRHDEQEIVSAMRTAIRQKDISNFDDRSKIIEMFGIDSIIKRLDKALGQ